MLCSPGSHVGARFIDAESDTRVAELNLPLSSAAGQTNILSCSCSVILVALVGLVSVRRMVGVVASMEKRAKS